MVEMPLNPNSDIHLYSVQFELTTMDIQGEDSIQVVVRIKPASTNSFLTYTHSSLLLGKTPFSFDRVFLPDATQDEIYALTGALQVDHTLQGYNSCVFVYGQTGSGKTHTMIGAGCGIIQQSLNQIFKRVQEDIEGEYAVTCSYFEIYNEQLFDLMDTVKDKKLVVREDVKRGVFVEGLAEEVLLSKERGVEVLNRGIRTRHVGETLMNRESSRSHAIFSLSIQSKRVENGNSVHKNSKIHFVDLAGSERQKSTAAIGERLKEASNINKSLTTLGMVINCLSSDKSKSHVPFRDSKLTFVLRDSLSGNSKTFLIATIADNKDSIQETLSTLKFAQRAKMVKLQASINEQSLSLNAEVLKAEIRRLKDELARANHFLQEERKKKSSVNFNEIVVKGYSKSMEEMNEKISALVDMIPQLLEKQTPDPDETTIQSYLQTNSCMLTEMNHTLNQFIFLKNEVRAKASMEKLRMQDLATPYRLSLPRPDILKQVESVLASSLQPELSSLRQLIMEAPREDAIRLQREKTELEERIIVFRQQQDCIREEVERIMQQKDTENKSLQQRCIAGENRTFELEEANSNLLLELQMTKEQLKSSEEMATSKERVSEEYQTQLSHSGIHIETLSREVSSLSGNLSASAQKYRSEIEQCRVSMGCLEEQLVFQQNSHSQETQHMQDKLCHLEGEKCKIEDESRKVMERLQEEMDKNNELEAINIQLDTKVTLTEYKSGQLEQKMIRQEHDMNCLKKEMLCVQQDCEVALNTLSLKYANSLGATAEQARHISALLQEIQKLREDDAQRQLALQSHQTMLLKSQQQMCSLREEANSLQQSLQSQLEVSRSQHMMELQQLKDSYSCRIEELKDSERLKERCNELMVENYRLKSQGVKRQEQKLDTRDVSVKLEYYEEKFSLMKLEYNKSLETIRTLKHRQILIKQQNQKLSTDIAHHELELELRAQTHHSGELHITKSRDNKDTFCSKDRDNKENDRKEKAINSQIITHSHSLLETLDFLKGMISKLDGEPFQPLKQLSLEVLLKSLEESVRKKEGKLKKEMEKETKIKSQNHLVVKENLYLKERIKILEGGNTLPDTLNKKMKNS